jgi:hypothetical protein
MVRLVSYLTQTAENPRHRSSGSAAKIVSATPKPQAYCTAPPASFIEQYRKQAPGASRVSDPILAKLATAVVDSKYYHRYTYRGPLKHLFRQFLIHHPTLTLSYETFRKKVKGLFVQARVGTDLCPICSLGPQFPKDLSMIKPGSLQEFDYHVFSVHTELYQSQNESFNAAVEQLQPGDLLLVIDFKQPLFRPVGGEKGLLNPDFYCRLKTIILGIVCLRKQDGNIVKDTFTYVSDVQNKDAVMAVDCLQDIFKKKLLPPSKKVTVWSDNGMTFRADIWFGTLLDIRRSSLTHFLHFHFYPFSIFLPIPFTPGAL